MSKELQVINDDAPVVSSSDAMLAMIERVASNPDVDIVKMQALLDMRNQEIARVDSQQQQEFSRIAKQKFNTDYVMMSGELPLVATSKENAHTKSRYAALEDINEAIKPVLSKHGFALATNIVEQTKDNVTVEATLLHRDGHEKSTRLSFPLDTKGSNGSVNKTEIQGTASSITYAKRIAICALLNISTGDDKDGSKDVGEAFATEPQREAIGKLYRQLNDAQKDNFDTTTGGILEIRKKDVSKVIAKLNKSIAENKECQKN